MRPFGMEADTDSAMVPMLEKLALRLPSLLVMPHAVYNFTVHNVELTGKGLQRDWDQLLDDLLALGSKKKFRLAAERGRSRKFSSFTQMVEELKKADTTDAKN